MGVRFDQSKQNSTARGSTALQTSQTRAVGRRCVAACERCEGAPRVAHCTRRNPLQTAPRELKQEQEQEKEEEEEEEEEEKEEEKEEKEEKENEEENEEENE
eukprot:GHVU01087680.1.p2 GENE.GHVU01087680.1~~GHVU01087680.1.p2  ORF type:complete len:102 (-),score=45.17 GHVU01087680.1:4-309(-)